MELIEDVRSRHRPVSEILLALRGGPIADESGFLLRGVTLSWAERGLHLEEGDTGVGTIFTLITPEGVKYEFLSTFLFLGGRWQLAISFPVTR